MVMHCQIIADVVLSQSHSDEQPSISFWFYIGKFCDINIDCGRYSYIEVKRATLCYHLKMDTILFYYMSNLVCQ